jgi:NADPH:quinone reductase-like Zn-dependent oxidoreductase
MKAARLHAYGDIDQFKYEEIAQPVPGAGEVLVKIEASSLNPVELYIRQGYLAQMVPLELPAILGLDLAGSVAQVGSGVTGYRVGDRVIGKLQINGKGSNAEFTATAPTYLAKLADNVGFADAAALPLAGLTGRQAIDALGIKANDRILVTGALGSVGRAAVQYIKELGAVPVAGVRTARVAEARELGIEALAIGEPIENSNFDGALDTVGGAVAGMAIALVRNGGVLAAVAGVPEGANADGRIRIVNVLATEDSATLQKIADAAARGELTIPVAKTLRLSAVGEGHRLLAAGQVGGKIIFVP